MRTTLMIVFALLAVAEMATGVITTENHRPQIKHVADACGFLAFALAAGVWPASSWAGVGALILGCAGIVAGVFLASSDERAAAADKRRLGGERGQRDADGREHGHGARRGHPTGRAGVGARPEPLSSMTSTPPTSVR
jgi:hypothetical protein